MIQSIHQCAYIKSAGLAFMYYWTSVVSLCLEPAKASLLALCKCGGSCVNCIHHVVLLLLSSWCLSFSLPLSLISYLQSPFLRHAAMLFPGSDCTMENGCTVVLGPVWRISQYLEKEMMSVQACQGQQGCRDKGLRGTKPLR